MGPIQIFLLGFDDFRATGGIADELIASFEDLLAKGTLDLAFERLKELVRVYPGDARSNALFEKLADARVKAVKSPSGGRWGCSCRTPGARPRPGA